MAYYWTELSANFITQFGHYPSYMALETAVCRHASLDILLDRDHMIATHQVIENITKKVRISMMNYWRSSWKIIAVASFIRLVQKRWPRLSSNKNSIQHPNKFQSSLLYVLSALHVCRLNKWMEKRRVTKVCEDRWVNFFLPCPPHTPKGLGVRWSQSMWCTREQLRSRRLWDLFRGPLTRKRWEPRKPACLIFNFYIFYQSIVYEKQVTQVNVAVLIKMVCFSGY